MLATADVRGCFGCRPGRVVVSRHESLAVASGGAENGDIRDRRAGPVPHLPRPISRQTRRRRPNFARFSFPTPSYCDRGTWGCRRQRYTYCPQGYFTAKSARRAIAFPYHPLPLEVWLKPAIGFTQNSVIFRLVSFVGGRTRRNGTPLPRTEAISCLPKA